MIKLTLNKVAITPIDDPDKTKGGLWIPEQAKERCDQGIIKYVGPDCVDAKVGQYVLFSGYTGTLTFIDGEGRLIIMPEDFIVCELTEPPNVEVPGLYFKGKTGVSPHLEIAETLALIMPELDKESILTLAEELEFRGFRGPENNPYFSATYEQAMEYISLAFKESEWYQGIKVKQPRPTLQDYDKTTAGAGTRNS